MTETMSANENRLSRHAALAVWVCRLSAVAIPGLLLVSWILGEAERAALLHLGLPPDHPLSSPQLILASLLSLLPALAVAMALIRLADCFTGFARGDWFGSRQPEALAGSGRWLMTAGALTLVVPTALGLVLTLNAAPGARLLAVSLSSNGVLALLFGLAFWSLGRVWALARALAAENDAFV
ncbi:MAG: hypothetical protein ACOCXK_02455 [Rhodosalinus sp.]